MAIYITAPFWQSSQSKRCKIKNFWMKKNPAVDLLIVAPTKSLIKIFLIKGSFLVIINQTRAAVTSREIFCWWEVSTLKAVSQGETTTTAPDWVSIRFRKREADSWIQYLKCSTKLQHQHPPPTHPQTRPHPQVPFFCHLRLRGRKFRIQKTWRRWEVLWFSKKCYWDFAI